MTRKISALFILHLLFLIPLTGTASTNRFSVQTTRSILGPKDSQVTAYTASIKKDDYLANTTLSYGYHFIELKLAGARARGVVDHILMQNFGFAYGLADNWSAEIDVPVIYYNAFVHPTTATPSKKFGLGDIRLRTRFNILSEDKDAPLGFSLIAGVTLPTGNENFFVSDKKATGTVTAVLDKRIFKKLLLAVNVGVEAREYVSFFDYKTGSRFLGSVGARFQPTERLAFLADLSAATPAKDIFKKTVTSPSEAYFGSEYNFEKAHLKLNVGGGISLLRGAGIPLYRGMAGLTYSGKNSKSGVEIVESIAKNQTLTLLFDREKTALNKKAINDFLAKISRQKKSASTVYEISVSNQGQPSSTLKGRNKQLFVSRQKAIIDYLSKNSLGVNLKINGKKADKTANLVIIIAEK